MLLSYAWFSIAMAITATMSSTTGFGLMRFVSGLGIGSLVATTGAIVSEFAPPGKKNLCNAIVYSGVPFGSLLSALLAIMLLAGIGWRGMFLIGALPIVTLLPLAFFKMPESPTWLLSRGRVEEARAVSERTGVPLDEAPPVTAPAGGGRERVGFAGLFSGGNLPPAILLGLMSVTGLILVYALNTWLPELMKRAGFSTQGSLAFLLVLNGGAVVGALIGSRIADRFGPKPVVAGCFLIGAVSIALLTLQPPDRSAAAVRRDRRAGHQRHADADLRLCGQLLPYERPRRRGGLVCGVRPARRRRRPAAGRPVGGRGPRAEFDLLRLGRGRRGGCDPDAARADPSQPRPALHADRAVRQGGSGRGAGRSH